MLVYFEIDNNIVTNIEQASIFNFDKELIESYVSVYSKVGWNEGNTSTYIRYQNISELKEPIPEEETNDFSQTLNEENNVSDTNINLSEIDEDFLEDLDEYVLDDDFLFEDEDSYRKIIPKSIKEEYALFGRSFLLPNPALLSIFEDYDHDPYVIHVDILDIKHWVPEDLGSFRNYYGINNEEVKDLINIFILQRRKLEESVYAERRSHLYQINNNLNKDFLRAIDPDLYPHDCVSKNWTVLLNQLSVNDIKDVYDYCNLLQPVLPESFCVENINLLSDKYGFPSLLIAEKYLESSVYNISTATEYSQVKNLLRKIENCGVKHLPDEGVPLCAINKQKLNVFALQLNNQLQKVLSNIDVKMSLSASNLNFNIEDLYDNDIKLKIGLLYDLIETSVAEEVVIPYVKRIRNQYDALPQSVHILFDSYLSSILESAILNFLEELSPSYLHSLLETISIWVDSSFVTTHADLIRSTFSQSSDFSDLNNAFNYKYISKTDLVSRYTELTQKFTVKDLAEFITTPNSKTGCIHFADTPIEFQEYILIRIVELYNAKSLHSGESIFIMPFNRFRNLEDFIRWLTELKSGEYGPINIEAIEKAITKAIEPLTEQEIDHLYEIKHLVKTGEKIITISSSYYTEWYANMEYQHYRDSLYDDSSSRYSGSWAHDEEGYSDDDIDTIFDGDPDAYWNID